jgi:hypothetical protein
VETRALNQAVRRNIDRFPEDFMFRLTREEIMRISQFVISSGDPGVRTLKFSKNVMAFTEHGVAMLSSVLNNPRAVQVNIQIMRTFWKLLVGSDQMKWLSLFRKPEKKSLFLVLK